MQCGGAIPTWQSGRTFLYMFLWIALSGTVTMYNKWILAYYGFAYPITLTMWHMAFCAALALVIIRLGFVAPPAGFDTTLLLRTLLPIGGLFALTLWLANATYMYLSVSFTQMLKVSHDPICWKCLYCEREMLQTSISVNCPLPRLQLYDHRNCAAMFLAVVE